MNERRSRLATRHLLASETAALDASAVVAALGGALHATDPTTPHIAVLMRLTQPERSALDRIVLDERSVVRHHAMRRTLWIMDVDLAGAAHEACTRTLAVREWTQFAALLRTNGVRSLRASRTPPSRRPYAAGPEPRVRRSDRANRGSRLVGGR